MERRRVARGLAWFLSAAFIILGTVEVGIRLARSDTDGLWFWFFSLCGGGALIAVGTLLGERRRRMAAALVILGGAAGILATAWTVVLPILALTMIVLTIANAANPTARARP
jgi:cytochrome bd-type quinol oxidase subunit 2